MRRLVSGFASIALLALLAPPAIAAAPIAVDCTNDPFALRSAVTTAPPGSTLVMNGTCHGVLDIDRNLTLTSANADARLTSDLAGGTLFTPSVVVVEAGATVRLKGVTISEASIAPYRTQVVNHGKLTLVDSTITHGGVGAINNDGTLTLRGSKVTENYGFGRAPISNSGSVTLIASLVSRNHSDEDVAGIANTGIVTLIDSTVADNSAPHYVITNSGTMVFRNSRVTGNTSSSASLVNTGTMSLTDSAVIANTGWLSSPVFCGAGAGCGGGISNSGSLLLRDTSVRGNTAGTFGGGIYNVGTATLRDSQVVSNAAGYVGGGIYNLGSINLRDVTIRDNTPNDCSGC